MDVTISNTPPAPRHTLPRVGWSVGKTVHTVKTPISDRSHVRFSICIILLTSSLVCQNLKIPLENCWVLRFPPNYFDYSFGQLFVLGVCEYWVFVIFSFLISLGKDGDMGKTVDLEGGLA